MYGFCCFIPTDRVRTLLIRNARAAQAATSCFRKASYARGSDRMPSVENTPSTDHLEGVLLACVQEQNATREPAGQAASFDILMDRAFERRHADLCKHLRATRMQSMNAEGEVGRLSSMGFFDHVLAGASLRTAKAALTQRQSEKVDACNAVDDARKAFYADPTNAAHANGYSCPASLFWTWHHSSVTCRI